VSYGAGLNVVDFAGATEKARVTINDWVEKKTEDRIKEILPIGAIDGDTRMVLVNAVYFNASWAKKFEPSATAPAPFTRSDGSVAQVSMMHETESMEYGKGDGWEAVSIPYDGNELALLNIVPTSGTFAAFESALTGGRVLDILAGLTTREVNLSFPKIKLEGDFGLKEPLRSLGMVKAFEAADFSGISTKVGLHVGAVLHKTFLSIDEKGTEAAAATAVTMKDESAAIDVVEMKVDRPFITAIVDRKTKALVFLGRILAPKI
jgi:serpin B